MEYRCLSWRKQTVRDVCLPCRCFSSFIAAATTFVRLFLHTNNFCFVSIQLVLLQGASGLRLSSDIANLCNDDDDAGRINRYTLTRTRPSSSPVVTFVIDVIRKNIWSKLHQSSRKVPSYTWAHPSHVMRLCTS